MFLYVEVLAMVGADYESKQVPITLPIFIAITALARTTICRKIRILSTSSTMLPQFLSWRLRRLPSAIAPQEECQLWGAKQNRAHRNNTETAYRFPKTPHPNPLPKGRGSKLRPLVMGRGPFRGSLAPWGEGWVRGLSPQRTLPFGRTTPRITRRCPVSRSAAAAWSQASNGLPFSGDRHVPPGHGRDATGRGPAR